MMRCRSIRVKPGYAEDESGRQVVVVTVGNMRRVGCVDEVAWVEMSPGMARSIAYDLYEVAREIEKQSQEKR
jgi:hypothetical protein